MTRDEPLFQLVWLSQCPPNLFGAGRDNRAGHDAFPTIARDGARSLGVESRKIGFQARELLRQISTDPIERGRGVRLLSNFCWVEQLFRQLFRQGCTLL